MSRKATWNDVKVDISFTSNTAEEDKKFYQEQQKSYKAFDKKVKQIKEALDALEAGDETKASNIVKQMEKEDNNG